MSLISKSQHPFYLPVHQHGGQLRIASQTYGIRRKDWVDLSTGISPYSYPLPSVPVDVWQRLPETNDGLEERAEAYYGSAYLLPVAGSQQAIHQLPLIAFQDKQMPLNIGMIKPAYQSHHQAWSDAGHKVIALTTPEVEKNIDQLDVLVVVNPTNPTCEQFGREQLNHWHECLQKNNGWLLVDEAFVDATPDRSLITKAPKKGLIVLRSVGKFYGLAGIRLGFVWADSKLLTALVNAQNDWQVSHLARWAGKKALADSDWQQQQRVKLLQSSERLSALLREQLFSQSLNECNDSSLTDMNGRYGQIVSTALFVYIEHPKAMLIYHKLAEQGVLVRPFDEPHALRFGLPASEFEWGKLEASLHDVFQQNSELH